MLAIAGVGALFALRPADPDAADPAGEAARAAEVRGRAAAARDTLFAFDRELDTAVGELRAGAGHVAAGEAELAGDALKMAARAVEESAGDLAAAQSVLSRLERWRACPAGELRVGDADLERVAGEVRAAIPLATAVAAVRRNADETINGLAAAVAALDRGEVAVAADRHAEARDALARARTAHDGVRSLMPTAAAWFETAAELVDRLGDVIDATVAGDGAAAEAAGAAYAAAGERAAPADRALAVALADASASVLGPPQAELANLRRVVGAAAARVGEIAEAGTCG